GAPDEVEVFVPGPDLPRVRQGTEVHPDLRRAGPRRRSPGGRRQGVLGRILDAVGGHHAFPLARDSGLFRPVGARSPDRAPNPVAVAPGRGSTPPVLDERRRIRFTPRIRFTRPETNFRRTVFLEPFAIKLFGQASPAATRFISSFQGAPPPCNASVLNCD